MDLGGRDPKSIITEQRDQLMRLRAQVKELQAQASGVSLDDVSKLVQELHRVPEGTMIGLKIPGDRRERLIVQQKRLKAKTYRQIVQACVELGLQMLEEHKDAGDTVEGVQQVQRTESEGDSTLRAVAGC